MVSRKVEEVEVLAEAALEDKPASARKRTIVRGITSL